MRDTAPGVPGAGGRALEDSDDLEILTQVARSRRAPGSGPVGVLLTLAIVAGTGASIWVGAGLFWRLVEPPVPAPLPVSRSVSTTTGTDAGFGEADLEALTSAHLFGPPPAAVEATPTPPPTPLDLSLKGIVHSDVAADARAIIAAPDHPQRAYGVNDAVPGNARVLEIRESLVILERNGLRESLTLESLQSATARSAAATPDRRFDERGNAALARTLRGFQVRLQTDPESAMSLMRLVPERNGDRMLGVRIYPGPEGGLFDQSGLEPGDLVTHVNAVPVDSTVRGLEALRTLAAARELSLSVRRGDRLLAFSFSVAR